MNQTKPLSGYRVVELSTFVAAPSCARLLADWGADVIKVEAGIGDPFRYFGGTMMMPNKENEAPAFELYNANKRGAVMDLKSAEGQEAFHKLLVTADVFVTNNRPEALKKLGLDYDNLKEKYPKLIHAVVTGFGEKGPDVDMPGFDVVAFWARSGFLADLVKPDEYPVYTPAGFGDLTVGSTLFGGICAALLNREKTGKGDKISVSLFGSAIWYSGLMIMSTQPRYGNVFPKARYNGNPLAIPYRAKDGEWIMLSVIEFERYWGVLCKAIGREELIADPRFDTRDRMMENKPDLIKILEEVFQAKTSAEWMTILQKADIVHDKLRHLKDVVKDEQAWANDYLYNFTFPNGEQAVMPSTPIQSVEMGDLPRERGPFLGEHTKEIMEELGYSAEQIERMKASKTIKIHPSKA
jgi:crotonobetainyl-CoA:carnitine CoA-transferase CaiB-like acyl-CoA transferase